MKIHFRKLIYCLIITACILGLCYLVKTSDWAGLIAISATLAILYVRYYPVLKKLFDDNVQPPELKLTENGGGQDASQKQK